MVPTQGRQFLRPEAQQVGTVQHEAEKYREQPTAKITSAMKAEEYVNEMDEMRACSGLDVNREHLMLTKREHLDGRTRRIPKP